MLASVGLQVIARYIFFSPPSWTEELARYCSSTATALKIAGRYARTDSSQRSGNQHISPHIAFKLKLTQVKPN